MKRLVLIFVTVFTFLPLFTSAHEGHGVINTGPAHYVLAPEHIMPIVLVLVVGVYFIRKWAMKKA